MSDKLEKAHRNVFGRILRHISPNQSSRLGARIRASVVHTTESADSTFWSIVHYLSTAGIPASAHYVIDALPIAGSRFTKVAMLVPESRKAWTALSANRTTVNYECVGRAARTRHEWLAKYRAQVRTLALLIADDIIDYRLPNRHSYPGYLGHVDLSRYGFPQTHTDPGTGFPWDVLHDDITGFLNEGKRPVKKQVKQITQTTRAPVLRRPSDAPKMIPAWAWQLREWHLGVRQHRPAGAPTKVPRWYWHWRVWYDRVHASHH